MDSAEAQAAADPPLLFGRTGKKRKIYRQRTEAAEGDDVAEGSNRDDAQATSTLPRPVASVDDEDTLESKKLVKGGVSMENSASGKGSDVDSDSENEDVDGRDEEEHGMTVAEIVRQRKARRPKLGGVEFRVGDDQSSTSQSLMARSEDFDMDNMDFDFSSEPIPMGIRFAPQTGLIGELVNKHMEEYVEAEMAKRYKADSSQMNAQHAGGAGLGSGSASGSGGGQSSLNSNEAREQLAMKGKLHEIDLGAEVRARNIAMTERATRRLRGTNGEGEDEGSESGGKARLGRDGKPLRKQRRGSDDIKRDEMVEQFLHENRMDVDVYDVGREQVSTAEGRPNDDRIAEQFRREFMEAMAQRMRRKRRPLGPPTKPKSRNDEEILRGPKLGGSRNVRSVMRDKLLQKQEEERQNMPKYEQQLQEQKRRANRRR